MTSTNSLTATSIQQREQLQRQIWKVIILM